MRAQRVLWRGVRCYSAAVAQATLHSRTWADFLSKQTPEVRKIYAHLVRDQGYVDGHFIPADNKSTFDVLDPATGELLCKVANMGRAECERAIHAAEKAFPAWKSRPAKERSVILRKFFDLMVAHTEPLAHLMTAECGKPLAEARGEIGYAASFIEWFSEEAKRGYGNVIPATTRGKRLVVTKEPIGVCALITPWNFPSAMLTRKIGAALAAGCTVVAKPGADTPLSAAALAVLAHDAGVPPGVLNMLPSSHETSPQVGAAMCESEVVRKLSFTGSTATGKALVRACASTMKRVSMELGGNAPFIVFDDADIDAAIEGALASKFRNAGQTCVCANRIFVQEKVYDEFVDKFAKRASQLKLGHGFTAGTVVGPLINARGVEKSERLVLDAVKQGATAIIGGRRLVFDGVPGSEQNFYAPTVLANAKPEMTIFSEEVFGPVAPLFRFSTEEEAIHLANNTRAGLAAYFYSKNVQRCWRVSAALEYGMVGVNDGMISTEVAPFGGVKESGLGREGSVYGMDEYLEIKYSSFGGIV